MKLQKATRCALFAILELAADPRRQVSAAEIADKFGISTNHLAKVLRTLGRAGLVEAVRGAGGGYHFCGSVKRTTLLDVIQLFETVAPLTRGEHEEGDDTAAGQALCQVLTEIEDTTRATFATISLATMLNLVDRHQDGE